jgi:hypothetical protein
MAIQTSFAKKVTWSQDGNHRFLALLGNDGELDLALLDVGRLMRSGQRPLRTSARTGKTIEAGL